jgi:pilus assembly protein Flp/PilA
LIVERFRQQPGNQSPLNWAPYRWPAKISPRELEFLMRQLFSRFLTDQSGATAIEYCLIAVGISIVIITAVNGLGSVLDTKFAAVSTSLK